MRYRLQSFSLFVLACALLFPLPAKAERSGMAPRIAVSPASLLRLNQIVADPNPDAKPYQSFLKLLPQSIPTFQSRIGRTSDDFKDVGGYSYCAKTVSAMGLLSLQGNKAARDTAKMTLLKAIEPFRRPIPDLGIEPASLVNNPLLPYAQRIRVYNLLRAQGNPVNLPSRGDPMYLETGMMASCIAVGFDWLLPFLSNAERSNVESAANEILLWSNNIHSSFFSSDSPAAQRESNWNAVMNGGSGLLGLATTDSTDGFSCNTILTLNRSASQRQSGTLDENAKERVCQAIVGLRFFRNSFTDSGSYPEGPTYWFYGMQPFSLFVWSLEKSFGRRDLDPLFTSPLEGSGRFMSTLLNRSDDFWESSTGGAVSRLGVYSFADTAQAIVPSSWPFQFIALKSGNAQVGDFGWRILNQQATNEIVHAPTSWAEHSLDWSRIFTLFFEPTVEPLPLPFERTLGFVSSDHRFDLVSLQAKGTGSPWILLQKGGSIQQPHAQLDSSSFTLRIGNSNWFSDLGSEYLASGGYPTSYFSLPSSPSYRLGLRFYRKNDLSHNLVTLASRPMNLNANATLLRVEQGINPTDGAAYGRAVWDTSSLYTPEMSRSSRVMTLTDRGRYTTLDILDTLQLSAGTLVANNQSIAVWRVLSCLPASPGAGVSLVNNQKARIRRSSNEALDVTVIRPTGALIRVVSADPNSNPTIKKSETAEVESSNTGCILLEIPANAGDVEQTPEGKQLTFLIRVSQPN